MPKKSVVKMKGTESSADDKALGNAWQVRLQKDVERELHAIAEANGIDPADALRMAARRGIAVLKEALHPENKKAAA
jgi:hypothetical protein